MLQQGALHGHRDGSGDGGLRLRWGHSRELAPDSGGGGVLLHAADAALDQRPADGGDVRGEDPGDPRHRPGHHLLRLVRDECGRPRRHVAGRLARVVQPEAPVHRRGVRVRADPRPTRAWTLEGEAPHGPGAVREASTHRAGGRGVPHRRADGPRRGRPGAVRAAHGRPDHQRVRGHRCPAHDADRGLPGADAGPRQVHRLQHAAARPDALHLGRWLLFWD
mmetsp:Transcript_58507/g.156627  ORF Transcript_58507/g.156627 Transcript_58507/m.156627 type:complete len:221 (+) Transcript_58507:332-994(+)